MKDVETNCAHWARSWDEAENESGPLGSVHFSKDKGARLFIPGERLLRLSFDGIDVATDPPTDLFGITNLKNYYILLSCMPGKTDDNGQEIISDTLFIGDIRFDHNAPISEIEFQLKGLENWAQGLGMTSLGNLSGTIDKELVHEEELYSDDKKRIALRIGYPKSSESSDSVTFERAYKMAIRYNQYVDLDQALDDAYAMLLLVSFCSGWYTSFTKVHIVNVFNESYDVIGRFKDDGTDSYRVSDSPISFDAFIEHCPEMIAGWIECSDDLETAIYVYVPLATEGRLIYGDLRIIAASQIFEALGRASNAAVEEDPEQVRKKKRLEAEVEKLPEGELRTWALKKLRKKKSITYRDRVRKVLADIGAFVDDVLPDKEGFINRQVKLRNDFVHRNPNAASQENEYLLYHTHMAMMLCQASIMRFIGFSESEIAAGLENYKRSIKRRFASYYLDDATNQ